MRKMTVIFGGKIHGVQRQSDRSVTTMCGRFHDTRVVIPSDLPVDCPKCRKAGEK